MRAFAVPAFLVLVAAPALAAPMSAADAAKAIVAVEGDASRLKSFCAMNRAMNLNADEGSAAAATADAEVMAHLGALGPEFKAAWDFGMDTDPESPDGQAINAAIEKLEDKCDK